MDLEEILPEVEEWTIKELIPVLAQGGFVEPTVRAACAAKFAKYVRDAVCLCIRMPAVDRDLFL